MLSTAINNSAAQQHASGAEPMTAALRDTQPAIWAWHNVLARGKGEAKQDERKLAKPGPQPQCNQLG